VPISARKNLLPRQKHRLKGGAPQRKKEEAPHSADKKGLERKGFSAFSISVATKSLNQGKDSKLLTKKRRRGMTISLNNKRERENLSTKGGGGGEQ